MAVDTKPNLSCEKFEQLSGDTLYLSGTTGVHGTMSILNGACFCMPENAALGRVMTSDAYGRGTWQNSSTPSGGGSSISKEVTQSSHGFVVGDVVGFSANTYNKAIADGTYDGEVIGIVSECLNSNTFKVTQAGYVTGLTGLVTGCTYFLSTSTAGAMTYTEPTGNSMISKSVFLATSDSTGFVLPYPGYVISTGGTGGGITLADNGLTTDGTTVCLGGTLCIPTTIALNSNLLCISDTNADICFSNANSRIYNCNQGISIDGTSQLVTIAGMISIYTTPATGGVGDYFLLRADDAGEVKRIPYSAVTSITGATAITGATNGLHVSGKNIVLGGILTGNTLINTNNANSFTVACDTIYGLQVKSNGYVILGDTSCTLGHVGVNNFGGICLNACTQPIQITANNTGFVNICAPFTWLRTLAGGCLEMSSSGNIFTDANLKGIEYASGYSANFTARSLVDKAYVDAATSGATGTITGGTNGLGVTGANICLGGALLNNTYINTDSGNLIITGGTTFGLDIRTTNISLGNYNSIGSNYITVGSSTELLQSGATYTTQIFQPNDCIRIGGFTNSTGNYTWMAITPTEMCIRSTESAFAGVKYYSDYSTNYTDRSLVDKGYVDAKLSGSTLNVFTITGDDTTTGFTINHNFNQQFVGVEVVEAQTPYATIYTDVNRPDANNVCVTFDIAPATGTDYKVLIIVSGGSGGGTYASLDAAINSVSSSSYTLQTSDRGKVIEFTNTGATTITLPSGMTMNFQAILVNIGGGNKTLSAGAGATLNTLNSNVIIAGAYNSASVYHRGSNNWVGFGNLS